MLPQNGFPKSNRELLFKKVISVQTPSGIMAKVTLLSVREEMCKKRRVTHSAWISFQHDSRRRESGGKAECSSRGHEADVH